jgi:hypothetical protein
VEKREKPDRCEASPTCPDPDKSQERLYEQTLKSSHSVMAGEDKKKLVELIKDWLRDGSKGDAPW